MFWPCCCGLCYCWYCCYQASLGIHPKDFLPIYVEEGWNFSLGDLLASAFFFLIMATIARDFLMGGAVNRYKTNPMTYVS